MQSKIIKSILIFILGIATYNLISVNINYANAQNRKKPSFSQLEFDSEAEVTSTPTPNASKNPKDLLLQIINNQTQIEKLEISSPKPSETQKTEQKKPERLRQLD